MTQAAVSSEFAPQAVPNSQFSGSKLEELRARYAEDGYLVLRSVVSKPKLQQLHARIIERFEESKRTGELFSGGGSMSGHLNCFPGVESRFAYEELQSSGVMELLQALFPKRISTPYVGCNLNLPKSVAQHYHVDSSFTDDFMIANVAVVDTDLQNGAIDVVPGSHKEFYKYWRFAVERKYREAKRLPLGQGDVLLRTSNLWHRGMPNLTNVPRPMIAFRFVEGGNTQDADPYGITDGKISFHENWFRPNMLGRLRERTFVAAPITYSAYRFVRSLVGSKGYSTP
jgi:ectoine hydroxylase-related dioxygenase (phytanoyl-CoA dioxygenase family)